MAVDTGTPLSWLTEVGANVRVVVLPEVLMEAVAEMGSVSSFTPYIASKHAAMLSS